MLVRFEYPYSQARPSIFTKRHRILSPLLVSSPLSPSFLRMYSPPRPFSFPLFSFSITVVLLCFSVGLLAYWIVLQSFYLLCFNRPNAKLCVAETSTNMLLHRNKARHDLQTSLNRSTPMLPAATSSFPAQEKQR